MGTKIEEDSLIVSSMPLDDNRSSSQEPIELTATICPSVVFSPCLEPSPVDICQPGSSLDIEVEPPANVVESNVAPVQSKRRENLALARRGQNKRKFKGFYTRAHYFRRCIFGKKGHGDVKKAVKIKPSFREWFQEDEVRDDYVQSSIVEQQPQESALRRGSVEKSSKSRIKGRYLETYLKRENNWIRRMVDGLFDKPDSFSSSQLFDRLLSNREISLRKTRYAEKILVRSIEFVAVRLRSDILKHFEQGYSSLNRANSDESRVKIGKRLYFKGRYFQRIFYRNFVRLINCIRDMVGFGKVGIRDRRRSSTMIKMRGRYLETYLEQNAFFGLRGFHDRFSPSVASSKRRFFTRTRYVERILKKHFESLGLIIKYIRSQILQGIPDSSVVIPGCSSLNSRQNDVPKENDVLSNFIRSSKDFVSTEVFHRGSRRLSRSCRGSISAGSSNLSSILKSFFVNWLPFSFAKQSTISEKKIIEDGDRDGRRLSFVPTILYEGLTNRIGVDFTRLVAYAFVPCTSIILLYMYK
ncbi:hypothetical protein ANTQUA_LOCUS3349 [Anthophora quadrimaculata]